MHHADPVHDMPHRPNHPHNNRPMNNRQRPDRTHANITRPTTQRSSQNQTVHIYSSKVSCRFNQPIIPPQQSLRLHR
jgi:hypothetical protein